MSALQHVRSVHVVLVCVRVYVRVRVHACVNVYMTCKCLSARAYCACMYVRARVCDFVYK